MTATGGVARYNVCQISGRYYVNDPDTMTAAPFPTMRGAERASRQLNKGQCRREELQWIDL
ncbi:hypothetical protein ACIGCK_04710 [Microbacterium sp. NPDC078428]|uniref:hypothetical protein n=1 Tax=Microbacterium sp. NPDC078428 TaxID=3364190 RepID=UPI0037C87119